MKVYTVIATNEIEEYWPNVLANASVCSNVVLVLDNVVPSFETMKALNTAKNLSVIYSEGKNNVYIARNTGIMFALKNEADYVLFTDSDCIVRADWENQMVKDGGDILVGWTEEIATKNVALTEHGERFNLGLGTNGIKFYCSGANVITTCNAGYSREVFKTIGMFPIVMSSDAIFGRMASKHFEIKLRPDAVVRHEIVTTLWDLFKKKMRYAESVINSPLTAPFWLLGSLIIALGVLIKAISFKDLKIKILFQDTWFVLVQDFGLGLGRLKQVFSKYKNIW